MNPKSASAFVNVAMIGTGIVMVLSMGFLERFHSWLEGAIGTTATSTTSTTKTSLTTGSVSTPVDPTSLDAVLASVAPYLTPSAATNGAIAT